MLPFVCVAHWKAINDLSSSAILTTTDLHFRAQQVVPKSGSGGVEEARGAFIRKLEPRTATRIVNISASPHTLGVESSAWSGWKRGIMLREISHGSSLVFLKFAFRDFRLQDCFVIMSQTCQLAPCSLYFLPT